MIYKEDIKTIESIIEAYLEEKGIDPNEEVWVDSQRAQEILGIKTTQLYLLRNDSSNGIIFSQPSRKVIMYKKESLYSYLNDHVV